MKRIVLIFIATKFLSIFAIAQNVGIGTSTPSTPLEIENHTNLPTTLLVHSGNTQYANGIVVRPSTHANSRRSAVWFDDWGVMQDAGGSGTKDFGIYQGSANAWRLFINITGNVGIGTTDPLQKLHLTNSSDVAIGFSSNSGNTPTQARIRVIDNNWSGDMVFETTVPGSGSGALTERMRINNIGNVGIGTSNPWNKFHTIGKGMFEINNVNGVMQGANFAGANQGQLEIYNGMRCEYLQSLGLIQSDCATLIQPNWNNWWANNNGGPAFISFHRGFQYGAHFGLDTDNWFSTQGWSPDAGTGFTNFKTGTIRSSTLSGSGNVPVYANNDGTIYKGNVAPGSVYVPSCPSGWTQVDRTYSRLCIRLHDMGSNQTWNVAAEDANNQYGAKLATYQQLKNFCQAGNGIINARAWLADIVQDDGHINTNGTNCNNFDRVGGREVADARYYYMAIEYTK